MESRPVKTIPIHDHLRGKLCDLYENDCIFDKFECTWGGDDKCVLHPAIKAAILMRYSRHVLTGSYHNYFRIYDTETLSDVVLQADKSAFKAKKIGGTMAGGKMGAKNGARPGGLRDAMTVETLDFNKKILHASWHPRENTIAVSIFSVGFDDFPLISG
jgi:serine/threonine-protein phosphatase 2A regulatory subunit B